MDGSQPASSTTISLKNRFRLYKFSYAACLAAIHGRKVPRALGNPVHRTCILRGMRYHHGFGTELRNIPDHPEFTRALNARDIMSNIIPEMKEEHEFPYCIWYPEVAKKETYRMLAKRYEGMRYQVGRACAVAGYVDVWRELDLLPEVAIAEEARDNEENGRSGAIFEQIMKSPVRYAVMNDYDRTADIKNARAGACLNADTAVRSSLQRIHSYVESYGSEKGFEGEEEVPGDDCGCVPSEYYADYEAERYWNITEDWCISNHNQNEQREDGDLTQTPPPSEEPKHRAPPTIDERIALLYSPLPPDLPNIHKDLLILHAAASGNIDRYDRLKRPIMVQQEYGCIIRGVYHSTMFAKWWSIILAARPKDPYSSMSGIEKAINARFIMNNDLSRITENTFEADLPDLIHYPNWAHWYTYEELVRRQPKMTLAVAQACIVANYEDLFRKLKLTEHEYDELMMEAMRSHNPYYIEQVFQNSERCASNREFYSRPNYHMVQMEPRSVHLPLNLDGYIASDAQGGPYNGSGADFSDLDLFVCAPDHVKIPDSKGNRPDLRDLYHDACYPEEKIQREAAAAAEAAEAALKASREADGGTGLGLPTREATS